jgi:beta-galactosidase
VLERRFGAGRAIYLGTRLDHGAMSELLGRHIIGRPGTRGTELVPGLERVVRRTGATDYEFLINHTGAAVKLSSARGGRELLSGAEVTDQLELAPQGVAIVRREGGN